LYDDFARSLGLIPHQISLGNGCEIKQKADFLPLIKQFVPKQKTKKNKELSTRIQFTRFLKSTKLPVRFPLTSGLGLQLVKDFGNITTEEKKMNTLRVSKFCKGISCDPNDTPLDVKEAKMEKDCHQFSFNSMQRLRRKQELVLGNFEHL
jgi:hypothetical protein